MEHAVQEMRRLVANVEGVSAKIRTLGAAGYERADIARFLGKKYQHVRNVLEQEKAQKQKVMDAQHGNLAKTKNSTSKVKIGPDGRIVIPVAIREALGLKEGDTLWVSREDDELRLSTVEAITRKVRALVREHVPEGVSLVDELIKERRQEFEREMRGE